MIRSNCSTSGTRRVNCALVSFSSINYSLPLLKHIIYYFPVPGEIMFCQVEHWDLINTRGERSIEEYVVSEFSENQLRRLTAIFILTKA